MNLNEHRRNTRKAENQALFTFSKYAPLAIKQTILEQNYDAAIDGLRNAIKGDDPPPCVRCGRSPKPEAWALRLWFEAAGVVGQQQQVILAVLSGAKVGSEEELYELVQDGKQYRLLQAGTMASLEELRDDALEVLRSVLAERPDWRANTIERLKSRGELEGPGGTQGAMESADEDAGSSAAVDDPPADPDLDA